MPNVDERFLAHSQESRRRQQAMRAFLTRSSLHEANLDGRALDLLAQACAAPLPGASRPAVRTAALTSDDR